LGLCCGEVFLASGAISIKRRRVSLWRLQSRGEGARHNEQTFTLGWKRCLNGERAHARQPLNGGSQPFARCREV
jgi:hypothetical protein